MTTPQLAQTFDLSQTVAGLLSEDTSQATVVAEYQTGDWPPLRNRVVAVTATPAFEYLLGQKAPLVVDDAQTSPELESIRDLAQSREVVSLLLLPLVIEGEVLGGWFWVPPNRILFPAKR